jgi:signal transduction histidine kinase/ligand-binding sensor domain-containing protein
VKPIDPKHHRSIDMGCGTALLTPTGWHKWRARQFSLWASLIVLLIFARTGAALQPDLSLSQLKHTAWKASDGAPADIWALTQSSDGFLLLGTGSGVYRFDGVMFDRVVPSNSSDLAYRNVTALMALPSEELWIGYYAGGVSHLKDGVLTSFAGVDGVPGGWVTSFAVESDGTLWVAALEGLGRFANGRWESVSSSWNFPGHSAHWVLLDRMGTLWVAGGDTVAFLRKGSHKFEDTGIRSGYASTLTLAPDGMVWLAGESIAPQPLSKNGVLTLTSVPYAQLNPTKRLLIDGQGAIWGTDARRGGIYRSTPKASDPASARKSFNAPETFDESSGLTSDKAVPVLEDREGNIWVGTNLGLNRFRRAPFVTESRVNATSRMGYSLAASAPNGVLWIASDNDLFESQGSRVEFVMHLPARIRSAYLDSSGVLWLGTEGGLYALHNREKRYLPLPSSANIPYQYVHAISSDGTGGLWVSVINRGLLRLHDGVWETPAAALNFGAGAPTALWTDDSRRQWFGYSDGTVRVREGERTRVYGPAEGLRVGPVALIRGSKTRIFAAGEWGLGRFENGMFRTLSASRSDAFGGITGILVEESGDILLNGNRGVVYLTSDALEEAFADSTAKPRYQLYDVHDGLPGYAQQNEDATAIAADGRFWFATNHGLAWYDPGHCGENLPAPKVLIRHIQIDGRNYPTTSSIQLPSTSRSLRIDYTAMTLAAPERISFRYKLEGVDDGWRNATNERSVRYANLRPGSYTFRVTASNDDGVWNRSGASVGFSIAPAYYQTTWFKSLFAILSATLLWILYYLRLRYITERQRKRIEQRMEDRFSERTRIARELHDTLLQSLQGSLMRYQVAHELLPEHPSEAKQDLGKAIDQTVRAITEGRSAVQGLRSTEADSNDLADSIKKLVEELDLEVTSQEVIFRLGLQGNAQPLQAPVLHEVYEIAREALRNARHHSRASEIEVDLHYDPAELRLRVRDNGIGIDPKFLKDQGEAGHYGLQGLRERAELLGGKLGIWSAAAGGTEIELTLPGPRAYTSRHPQRFSWLSRILSKRTDGVPHE